MGTQLGKVLDSIKRSESELNSKEPLEDPPVPPPPDPRLPLTAKQLFNITKSWKGIARAMEPTGITMFVKLFEENEDILHLFQKFQYKRLTEWHTESMELAQHASIVMSTLNEGIKTLGNVDNFQDHLHSVGKLHRKIPGFQKDYFWRIERPFLAAVQETLGDRYTENMEKIYKITIRYVLTTVVRGFDLGGLQAGDNETQGSLQTSLPSTSSNIKSTASTDDIETTENSSVTTTPAAKDTTSISNATAQKTSPFLASSKEEISAVPSPTPITSTTLQNPS